MMYFPEDLNGTDHSLSMLTLVNGSPVPTEISHTQDKECISTSTIVKQAYWLETEYVVDLTQHFYQGRSRLTVQHQVTWVIADDDACIVVMVGHLAEQVKCYASTFGMPVVNSVNASMFVELVQGIWDKSIRQALLESTVEIGLDYLAFIRDKSWFHAPSTGGLLATEITRWTLWQMYWNGHAVPLRNPTTFARIRNMTCLGSASATLLIEPFDGEPSRSIKIEFNGYLSRPAFVGLTVHHFIPQDPHLPLIGGKAIGPVLLSASCKPPLQIGDLTFLLQHPDSALSEFELNGRIYIYVKSLHGQLMRSLKLCWNKDFVRSDSVVTPDEIVALLPEYREVVLASLEQDCECINPTAILKEYVTFNLCHQMHKLLQRDSYRTLRVGTRLFTGRITPDGCSVNFTFTEIETGKLIQFDTQWQGVFYACRRQSGSMLERVLHGHLDSRE